MPQSSDPTTAHARPSSLRIFLADGSPTGIRIIEKSNWVGQGIVFPRSLFSQIRDRPELDKAGLYVLKGTSDDGNEHIYIGEGVPVRSRLTSHGSAKDFWTQACVFVSKDDNITKTHVQYLESRLLQLAREAKRSAIENIQYPPAPRLSDADRAEIEGFLEEMLVCYPVIGFPFFDKPASATQNTLILTATVADLAATGYESDEGFVVRAGSQARIEATAAFPAFVAALRQKLLENGALKVVGDHYIFTEDTLFSSPSTAAAAVQGRNANGRRAWKDTEGRMLYQIQEAKASDSDDLDD